MNHIIWYIEERIKIYKLDDKCPVHQDFLITPWEMIDELQDVLNKIKEYANN